ncbi:hypothetical protein LPW11_03495 [Geomonas sp. RF6]|uniref:NAD(P)/FAD-dependent oxidoreductase n=1 Tax=Geomonas sp. RF6 TaxID=2897342 RepID=UPI001E44EBF7|nr:hypothetical protein [Geomonas sp. RF6]UFS71262.1 hypothetical protein LPW11_03495 [Geomonas sp. RF6]
MPFLLRNLTVEPGTDEGSLPRLVAGKIGVSHTQISSFRIVRKGVDARKKGRVKLVYTLEFSLPSGTRMRRIDDLSETEVPEPPLFPRIDRDSGAVIVGMGPAGLFAALRLAEYGLTARIVERGAPVEERTRHVARFWSTGELNPQSNVQFGEGGAGAFSDGKLTTRVKDPNCAYVLEKLVRFGAPAEILYAAKPHVGTDRLAAVVSGIREHLIAKGFRISFNSTMTAIQTSGGGISGVVLNDSTEEACGALVLAPGHSARDTYAMLSREGVQMEQKPFAVGVRVEHPQELINAIQYGRNHHPALPAAEYALAYNSPTGRSAYSFCMCPGGVVVASSSEEGGVVTNGMSKYLRNAPNANSALVASVGPRDFGGDSPLAGVEFQRLLEREAFRAGGGGYRAPAQSLLAFIGEGKGSLSSSYRPGVTESDLSALLPPAVSETLREGIRYFDGKMRGFICADATLTGVETRTSAPLRIVRGDDLQSVSHRGLYPTGEGAGYAGGIMSAALDGIRVADAIAAALRG